MAYGRTVLGTIGSSISLLADGKGRPKIGGVTIDWSTVAAVSGSDAVLKDGVTVPIGSKYLRYGQLVTQITTGGKYGPYDPVAADGRQLLVRGKAFLVNRTSTNMDPKGDYPEVIDAGTVWRARLIQSEAAAHTLALGPTAAELETLFPGISYADF